MAAAEGLDWPLPLPPLPLLLLLPLVGEVRSGEFVPSEPLVGADSTKRVPTGSAAMRSRITLGRFPLAITTACTPWSKARRAEST